MKKLTANLMPDEVNWNMRAFQLPQIALHLAQYKNSLPAGCR